MSAIHLRRLSLCAVGLAGMFGLPVGGASAQANAAKPFLDAARSAVAAGNYVDALAAHADAIAAAPEDADAHAQRASLFVSLGQPDLAAGDYRAAVKLKPDDMGLQINLCFNLAVANHDLDGALAACNIAVDLGPTNYEALSARGYVHLRRGDWAAAESDFAAALAINSSSPNEMFGHGLAVIHLGRAQEGRDEIASATLDSAGLVSEWGARGFGARGEIIARKDATTAGQPAGAASEERLFLNSGEKYVGPVCGMILPKLVSQSEEASKFDGRPMVVGGECRFGLRHGGWTFAGGGETAIVRYAYGREISPSADGEALERKLTLAYQAAEKALAP